MPSTLFQVVIYVTSDSCVPAGEGSFSARGMSTDPSPSKSDDLTDDARSVLTFSPPKTSGDENMLISAPSLMHKTSVIIPVDFAASIKIAGVPSARLEITGS